MTDDEETSSTNNPPLRERVAAAIWEVSSDHPRVRGMSWPELLEAREGNPGAWEEHYQRCLRQADAAIRALGEWL